MKVLISRILVFSLACSSLCLDLTAADNKQYSTCEDVPTMLRNCKNGQASYELQDESGITEICTCPASVDDLCAFIAEYSTNPSRCLTLNDRDFATQWYIKDDSGNIKSQNVSCNCKAIKDSYCANVQAITENCAESKTFILGGTSIKCNCPSDPVRNFQEIGGVGGVAGLAAGLVIATGLILLLIVKLRQYVINKALQEFQLSVKEELLFKALEKNYRELSPDLQADFLSKNKDLFKAAETDSGKFKQYMSFDTALLQLKQVETIGKLMAQRGVQVSDLLGGKGFKIDVPKIGKIGQADITSALKGASGALESLDLKAFAFATGTDLLSQVTTVIEAINKPNSAKLRAASKVLRQIVKSLQDEIAKDPFADLADENADLKQAADFLDDVDMAIQKRINIAEGTYQDGLGSDVDTQAAAKRTDVTTTIQDDGTAGGNEVDKGVEPGKEDGVSGGNGEPLTSVEEAYDFR